MRGLRRLGARAGAQIDFHACLERVRRAAAGIDERIAVLAASQHGVVTRAQLLELGPSDDAIRHRVDAGRLRPIHRGVYAVGHSALTDSARRLAAMLATAPSAVSHLPAAASLGLTRATHPTHLSCERSRRPQPGLVVHRAVLPPTDLITLDGIVLTNVERTMLDLSGEVSRKHLKSLVREAMFQELTDLELLTIVLDRYPRRRRRGDLCRVVEEASFGRGITQGELERLFLDFLRERGLPEPELNVAIEISGCRFILDCLWREAGLVVELDGRAAHARDDARHDVDTRRDRILLTAGLRTIRVTWVHLTREPAALDRDLRASLDPALRTSISRTRTEVNRRS